MLAPLFFITPPQPRRVSQTGAASEARQSDESRSKPFRRFLWQIAESGLSNAVDAIQIVCVAAVARSGFGLGGLRRVLLPPKWARAQHRSPPARSQRASGICPF